MTLARACLVVCLIVLPAEAQRLRRAGARVDIHYDRHMIPHVFGVTDEAALYGLGYHHVREFPVGTLNMLWLYSGRMAEIAGDSYLDEDSLVRLWEVPEIADRHRSELQQKELLPLIEAYVRGIEAGRAWWRGKGEPADSGRLDALIGPQFEVNVDRAPDYLNQAFSPFGSHGDPEVPGAMRGVLNRLFSADMPVTVDHVLRLGVAINSFFLLHSNEVPVDVLAAGAMAESLPNQPDLFFDDDNEFASNGWMVSPLRTDQGYPLMHSDGHVGLNKLQIRPYLIQVRGTRYQATGLTMPGYPALYAGYNDRVSWLITAIPGEPVVRNTWQVTLEDSPNPQELRFAFSGSSSSELVFLQRFVRTIDSFDPLTGEVTQNEVTHYYVPLHPDEPQDIGFERYPVVSHTTQPPLPADDLSFQQAAFAVEASPWEYMLRMGRARNATTDVDAVLADALFVVGDGINLLVADTDGNFRYLYMVRVPVQGAGVPPSEWNEEALLDGSQLSWRWQGFHQLDELPQIGPVDVSSAAEIWIANNVTPDKVEELRFSEADLRAFPGYMVSQESITTWRQERAIESLRLGPAAISRPHSQSLALDETDNWMHRMWPLYVRAYGIGVVDLPAGVPADVPSLVQWIEEYRDHDEQDQPNPLYDFVAHEFSQVEVYATLLRSHYLERLNFLHQEDLDQGGPGLTELQLSLGEDPDHPLFGDPSSFTYASYGPNIEAMLHSFGVVATLWIEGAGEEGLQNQELLFNLSAALPGDPWGDPRYDSDIEPHWQNVIAGTKTTRWGHVNVLSLTPHQLIVPKLEVVEGAADGGDPLETIRGYVYSALFPPALQGLPYEYLKIPFYDRPVVVMPLGGVRSSMFFTQHKRIHEEPPPLGYQQSVYRWDPDDFLFHHPMSSGSQTLFSVQLGRANDAQARPVGRGRFLQAIGGTEITQADLLGDGELAHQVRFAPTSDFAAGRWNELVTAKALLGQPTHTLRYVVLEEAGDRNVDLTPPSVSGPGGE